MKIVEERMLDGHVMHLISYKNLVLISTPFFLLQPLEYVYSFISQWKEYWRNITIMNISSENDWIWFIDLFWTAYLSFEKIKKKDEGLTWIYAK